MIALFPLVIGLLLLFLYFFVRSLRSGKQQLKTEWKKWSMVAVIVLIGLGFGVAKVYSAVTAPNPQCTTAHVVSAEQNPHRPAPPARLQTALDYFAQEDNEYDQGHCAQAIAAYTQAIKLNNHYAEAYNNRAYTYMQENDYARALPDLDQAIQLRPHYVNALMNRGDLYNYYYPIDRQKAIRDYDQVIALGAAQGTSVCSHRILAVNQGWNVGTLLDIFTHLRPPLDGC